MGAFLDVIILGSFQNVLFSGYDVICFVQNHFGTLISAGKVYSNLYAMERENLIVGSNFSDRKRVYKITEKGNMTLRVVTSRKEVERFLNSIVPKTTIQA
jgi:DNA-binding PadR family transcriptional regulator